MPLAQVEPRTSRAGKPDWLYLPTLESTDEEIRGYFNTQLDPNSHRRRYHTQRAALNLWFYLGRQWIEPRAQLSPGNGTYHFREIYRNSLAAFPRPVTNIIAPSVDNEIARLGRKELVPDTSPAQNKPEWQAAARLAKDILTAEMAQAVWGDKRDEMYLNFCIDAVTILRTGWDENDRDKTLVASPDTVQCPVCRRKFSSKVIPRGFATLGIPSGMEGTGPVEMFHKEGLTDFEETGEASAMHRKGIPRVTMEKCPYCEKEQQLEPYRVSEKEAGEMDALGRPMGLLVPTGSGEIDPISLHEYYPENGGIQLEPREQVVFHSMMVRPLEWIALRHGDELGDEIRPEAPQNLLRMNPLYAEPILSGVLGYNVSTGMESFRNHARFQEVVVLPQPHIQGLERGAIFHKMSEGQKIIKRELMVEVEGDEGNYKYVPRIQYHFARFKRIPRNFWGRTFVDDIVPIQRRLNELDAQVIDLRERGKPSMYLPKGTTIATRDDVQGSMVIFEYDSPDPTWVPHNAIFPGVPITGNPYFQERNQIMQDAQAVGFPQDIEMGQSPGSVKTTSGLMLISEEASQKRAPRERALALMFEGAFTHLLQMNWAFRKEDQALEVKTAAGTYEQKSFTGTDLVGDIRVSMDARAGYDQTLYNKEAAAEAMDRGLYVVDSPDARDKLLDLMRLPKDVNEGAGIQIRRAEMAWSDFMNLDKLPDPDYSMFDFPTWYGIFSKRWMDDDCYTKQQEVEFPALWVDLVTWEEKLGIFEQMEMQFEAYKEVPPDQWPAVHQQGQAQVEEAKNAYQEASVTHNNLVQTAMAAGAAPPMPPEPPPMDQFPQPPPQGFEFLPDALHLRIYEVWKRMLPQLATGLEAAEATQKLGVPGQQAERMTDLDLLLRMRAIIEAFKMLSAPPPMMPMEAPPEGPPPEGPPQQ